jgi:hypothetical protein
MWVSGASKAEEMEKVFGGQKLLPSTTKHLKNKNMFLIFLFLLFSPCHHIV